MGKRTLGPPDELSLLSTMARRPSCISAIDGGAISSIAIEFPADLIDLTFPLEPDVPAGDESELGVLAGRFMIPITR